MKDIADAVEMLIFDDDVNESCNFCDSRDACGSNGTWCMNAIKAKIRGQNTWDPNNPI
jgi:hypothetical protein